ncbi:hypothetical protein U1Q18_007170 [Sarracenia purpurea var. burkii]
MAPNSNSFISFSSQIALVTAITSIFILSSSSLPSDAASTTPTPSRARPFKKIFAFGDSFTDTGNTKSTTGPSGFNFVSNPPYGRTFFHRPTNRYSDGRLVIDFVAEALSLPYLPPYLNRKADTSTGVNFAVAGSTAIPYSFFVRNNLTLDITPVSIRTELSWFNEHLETHEGCEKGTKGTSSQCNATVNEALFWVGEIGVNDYAYSLLGGSVKSKTVRALAIKSVTGFLQAILTKGAKYIVVQSLPPSGCLPLALTLAPKDDRDDLGCVASANNQTYFHNLVLQGELRRLRAQFPAAFIVYADYWNSYRTVVKNAGKFGFKQPFRTCCGSGGGPYNYQVFDACGSPSSTSCPNPAQYINWDGVHLTEAMYKVISESFLNGSFSHPPFKYLLRRKKEEAPGSGMFF